MGELPSNPMEIVAYLLGLTPGGAPVAVILVFLITVLGARFALRWNAFGAMFAGLATGMMTAAAASAGQDIAMLLIIVSIVCGGIGWFVKK